MYRAGPAARLAAGAPAATGHQDVYVGWNGTVLT